MKSESQNPHKCSNSLPSKFKNSPVRSFEFIKTCYEHIELYKEDSVIFIFKDDIYEIYNQISSYSTDKKEKSKKAPKEEPKETINAVPVI